MMFSQETTLIGDVDCSGEVNSQDASLILQFVTNVIDELPCEANMTGLTPEQLQEIINMMDEQLSINYTGGGGSNYPIMISSISSETMKWGEALIYCDGLEQDGYSDWFLPNLDQLAYAVSGGCNLPDERTENAMWTTSKSHYGSNDIIYLYESGNNGLDQSYGSSPKYCRCVRFGEGETSEGSSGSSNSSGSGSSIAGSSEQPITMIGPRFTNADFPNFPNYYTEYFGSDDDYLLYADALVFCSQLEYDGYSDWFLPNYSQIEHYLLEQQNLIFLNGFDGSEDTFWTRLNTIDLYNASVQAVTISISGDNYVPYSLANTLRGVYSTDVTSYNQSCFCVR